MDQSYMYGRTWVRAGTFAFLLLFFFLFPSISHAQIFQLNTTATLSGVYNSSVVWGDYDNDGDLDILLTGRGQSNVKISRVYRNDEGTFTNITANLPDVSNGSVAWGDYDNDGDLDILLTGLMNNSTSITGVYRNDGGAFTNISTGLPNVYNSSVAWGDYDNDGDLDILITGLNDSGGSFNRVYRNDGGTFTNINAGLPSIWFSSVAWGDYDNDGDLDILMTGTNGSVSMSRVYRNDGGTFTNINAGLPGVYISSVAWGDYDNDGDLDILLAGFNGSVNISRVYQNNGGTFADINAGLPDVSEMSAWGDYDNDGDLDILLTGYDGSTIMSRIYRNDGGTFTNINAGLSGVFNHSSVAWGDYDNDGRLDILLTGMDGNGTPSAGIWKNTTTTANTTPAAPTGLILSGTGTTSATLSWNRATDEQTPQMGLTYNVRIGTTAMGINAQSPMASLTTGYRRIGALGNKQQTTSTVIRGLMPGTTYYWSVQSVDGAFTGSVFATTSSFSINASPHVSTSQTMISMFENGAQALTVLISDDNPLSQLVVTATSSNQTLLPNANLAMVGVTGATTQFIAMPVTNASGTAHVTVTVSDGQYSASTIFTVTVLPVNDAPTISTTQTAVSLTEDTAGVLTVSVEDIDNSYITLIMTTISDNQSLIPNSNLIQNGSTGATTAFFVNPVTNASGTAHVTVTVSDGQYSASTIFTVIVLPVNDPPMAVNDRDSVCFGSTHTLLVLGNDSDVENDTLMISAVTQGSKGAVSIVNEHSAVHYVPAENMSGEDTFTYTVSDGNGDSSIATVSVYIGLLILVDAGADKTICLGSSIQLMGQSTTGSLIFHWSPATGLSSPDIATPVASPTQTTVYTLTASDINGCSASSSVTITVLPAMVVSVSSNATLCAGSSTQLTATGGISYSWSPIAGLSNPNIANPVASPTTTTTYTVAITNAAGCQTSTSVTVTVNALPVANAGMDVSVCTGASVQLQASGGISYSWSPAEGLSNPNIANPIANPGTTTVYVVTITNVSGCSSTDAVVVSRSAISLNVTAILEGAYTGSTMSTLLQSQGFVPNAQPYNSSPFTYNGSENVTSVPANIVDWVLIELRTDDMGIVARKAAMLRSDGRIVGTDGGAVLMSSGVGAGSYYIVIRHRNHLAIMSSVQVSIDNNCEMIWNFTSSAGQAYEQFPSAMKEVALGIFGMVSGDVNADGANNAADRVEVRNATNQTGYVQADINLDGIVNAIDRVGVRNNNFTVSQVP